MGKSGKFFLFFYFSKKDKNIFHFPKFILQKKKNFIKSTNPLPFIS